MADDTQDKATESGEARQRWVDEVQQALDRTGEAVKSAWEATRESRMSALESAKQAAQELGEVIDQGISAAKERWAASEPAGEGTPSEEPFAEEAPKEPIEIESEPTSESRDLTITPVETETTEES